METITGMKMPREGTPEHSPRTLRENLKRTYDEIFHPKYGFLASDDGKLLDTVKETIRDFGKTKGGELTRKASIAAGVGGTLLVATAVASAINPLLGIAVGAVTLGTTALGLGRKYAEQLTDMPEVGVAALMTAAALCTTVLVGEMISIGTAGLAGTILGGAIGTGAHFLDKKAGTEVTSS